MRLTRNLRRLLEGHLVALALLAATGGLAVLLGGNLGSLLSSAVLWGLFLAMSAWLVVAYFAGASPETYLRADTDQLTLMWRSPSLVLPEDNPAVMEDLKKKLVGNQSDVMMWAGGNAVLCFGLGLLFLFLPVVTLLGLVAAIAGIGTLLARSR